MLVKLSNNWFAPNGVLYKASHSPHTLPDNLKEKLPKSAKVLEEKKEAPKSATK